MTPNSKSQPTVDEMRQALGAKKMADGGLTWKSPDWKPHPENDLLQPIGASRMVGDEKLMSQDDTFSHGLSQFPSSKKSYRYLYHGEDKKPIGSMQIQTSGPRSKKAVIQNLYVAEDNRREGIASKLLKRARQDFDVKHSTDLTTAGKAFAKAVKAEGGTVEPTVSQMLQALAKGGKVQVKRLYHGTDKEFKRFNVGSYLTDDPDYASKHGKIVMPVHMSATKIAHVLDEDFRLMAGEPSELKPYIDAGYDALKSDAHNDYIILDPSKVKSAITNMAKGGSVAKEPKSTVKAYKLFRVHKDHPGKLFPLFVDANTPVEMNKWVDAKEGDMKDGKVKSKIGALAYRPGWHAGDLPMATHIGEKSDPSVTAPDRRPANHAWAEVEMPDDVDWQAEATKRGTNADGKLVPVKAHITDQIPKGGHYRYKTNPNMTGNWLIGGSMKVNKVLSDAEVERINKKAGMADLPRTEPFAKKTFGFAQGGSASGLIAPEEFKAEEYVNYKAEGGKVELTPDQMREALRQKMRNGMYSPLERLAVDIPRNKGTGAEFMAEISKRPGFKPEEVADRKIPIPEGKMTKLEFLKHLRQHSNPPLKEHMLQDMGNTDEARDERANNYYGDDYDNLDPNQRFDVSDWVRNNTAKYSQYQIPGGENYREMLLKLPSLDSKVVNEIMSLDADRRRTDPAEWQANPDSQRLEKLKQQAKEAPEEYTSSHWKQHPNTLAHVRLSDREGPNGEKLLHMEELQSDWHQQGRQRGYKKSDEEMMIEQSRLIDEHEAKVKMESKRLSDEYKAIKQKMRGITDPNSPESAWLQGQEMETLKKLTALSESEPPVLPKTSGLPQAPFKKSWHELGMKHVLHHAAKNGYDGVVMTPGIDQARRWGDEGLKVHYDKKIPEFLNKFGKPFGVQMKPHSHRIEGEPQDYGDASERLGLAGVPMNQLTLDQNRRIANEADYHLHHFPINDQMRTSILKEGMPQYMRGGLVHKAEGGAVLPIEQIKAQMMKKGLGQLQSIGANEAPSLGIKAYVSPVGRPDNNQMPVGGIDTSQGSLPVGGIDMSKMQAGNQLAPQGMQQGMNQVPQGDKIPTMDGTGMPPNPNANPNQMGSNILQMTPQGQAMAALKPQGLKDGGSAKSTADMKAELEAKKKAKVAPVANDDDDEEEMKAPSKRILVKAEGAGGVTGIVIPHHMLHGRSWINKKGNKVVVPGLKDINKARAEVYGSENRDPLSIGQTGKIHKETLEDHFAKPLKDQLASEKEATARLRAAKHLGSKNNTLDESEKLDTVRHETDEEGRTHVGFASKGVAGHALYTSGHGKNEKHHIINTCPGQTEGCGGGKDSKGVIDTSRGTCFAPNAESQYVHAAVRRATHEQSKHDPKMTRDWILAHTGSMRDAANKADKSNQRLLFRPNVVDETDVSSRHVIRHLNEQRKVNDKPPIIANSYGKTNELHDPENGYHVTHSNVGPKVKKGLEISENIARDKARVRNTIMASDNKGDFKNEQGHKTPPKGSYMVTDVKRGSEMSKNMEKHITHAKYWTTGREKYELTPQEKEESAEGHFGGNGKPSSEDEAHYGHKTIDGKRYDYQKQHILHPRLVNVPVRKKNKKTGEMETKDHMIPTDSRFKDTEFLPKNKFKTKNGKDAGHILMTTPTESTSNIGHETSFTHNVSPKHIEHAIENKGEYEIDKPEDQIKASDKEYRAPQSIKFYAEGGQVGERHEGFSDDDFHAFPEQNVVAQRHLAMRGHDKEPITKHGLSNHKHKVTMNKDMDTMVLELTRNKKAK
jgi:hypothetical protein